MLKFKQKKLLVRVSLSLALLILFSGFKTNVKAMALDEATQQVITEAITDNTSTQINNNISQNLIYETSLGSIRYKVYTSRSIDTFLIAAALYNNFQGNYIMPNSDQVEIFKAAKEYFSPYANHTFIKNFGKYMALNKANDIDSSILGVLLSYTDLPDLSPKIDVSDKLPYSLKSKENLEEFLTELKSFYNDTHAEDFFNKNSNHYDALASYVKNNEDASATIKLINGAVDYVGNKSKYYDNKEIVYCTLLSFYRTLGSFYTIPSGNSTNFVSIQYAYKSTNQSQDNFDINNITKTSIHEYLHNFINTPVYENLELINNVTNGKYKVNYCSQTYYEFPWNRITDENFVRAIEARLYKNVFNENLALNNIIYPETKNGFTHVQALYNKLDYYEKDRQSYTTINDFIPQLINELYS